jgi:hypothetical protein
VFVDLHRYLGFAVVGAFAVGWIWGLGAWLLKRGPGDWYWRWVAVVQVCAIVQALVGLGLWVTGHGLPTWLHLIYGFLPLVLLLFAHLIAREGNLSMIGIQRREGGAAPVRPWVPFAWVSFICFGLSLRALMTGLGIG